MRVGSLRDPCNYNLEGNSLAKTCAAFDAFTLAKMSLERHMGGLYWLRMNHPALTCRYREFCQDVEKVELHDPAFLTPARLIAVVCAALLFLPGGSARGELPPSVVERVQQSVVLVEYPTGSGTGFLANDKGLILTNAHVVPEGDLPATITFADGTSGSATFVSYDPQGTDLAALRIDGSLPSNAQYLGIGQRADVRVGMRVFSAGIPFVLYRPIFATGMIGHHRCSHGLFVVDAAISSGSSGSPVFNAEGTVLGVSTTSLLDSNGDNWHGSGFQIAIDAGEIGRFVEALARGERETVRVAHIEALRMPLPHIEVGQVVEDSLAEDDDMLHNDLEYIKGYTIDLIEGLTYRISLQSDDFDAYLVLFGNDALVAAENDDAHEGTTDSEIIFAPATSQRFVLGATSFMRGETGPFRLSVEQIQFVVKDTIEAVLTDDSPVQDGGRHYFEFPLKGRNAPLEVTMRSEDVDSFLSIHDADGEMVAMNDDLDVFTTDSQIIFSTEEGSSYTIRASTFSPGELGAFTLTIAWPE